MWHWEYPWWSAKHAGKHRTTLIKYDRPNIEYLDICRFDYCNKSNSVLFFSENKNESEAKNTHSGVSSSEKESKIMAKSPERVAMLKIKGIVKIYFTFQSN